MALGLAVPPGSPPQEARPQRLPQHWVLAIYGLHPQVPGFNRYNNQPILESGPQLFGVGEGLVSPGPSLLICLVEHIEDSGHSTPGQPG